MRLPPHALSSGPAEGTDAAGTISRRDRILRRLGPFAALVCFALALWALQDSLAHYRYRDILDAYGALPPGRIAAALALTVAGYAALTGYDMLAFQFIGRRLAFRHIALASFTASAFGNNLGNTLITGATVRYWIYTSLGFSAIEVGQVVAFCMLGFWLGYFFLGAVLFIVEPVALPAALHLPFATTRTLGFSFVLAFAAYATLIALRRAPFVIAGRQFALPSPALTVRQIAVASFDIAMMGSALYVLLPPTEGLTYPLFLAIFMLALVAAAASQVPGGLGVFESVVLLLTAPYITMPKAAAALLAFRAVYFLFPLLVATLLVGLRESRADVTRLGALARRLGRFANEALPEVLAGAIFAAGAILLFSGALPAGAGRLSSLHRLLPLPFMEISHFLASLAGAGLLILARGLRRRLDGAYVITLVLLAAGSVFSLAKGFDYEEATVLAVMFAALAPCRARFFRKSSLLAQTFTPGWFVSTAIVLAGTAALGLFAFKHVEYSNELWWHFALQAEAPRALRAFVGAIAVAIFFASRQLLQPARPASRHPDAADIARARPIVAASAWTYPNLAFRGDKSLLFSAHGNAFIMYRRARQTWVAMGDPVGPADEARDVAWDFLELCDRYGGRPVFFEVRDDNRDFYLEFGLTLTKIGEEARVELARFELSSPVHAPLRQARTRVLRKGCTFHIMSKEHVPALLPDLNRISDAWLARKTTHEKGFSNASFDARYLEQFPVAVVRDAGGVIAFANLWQSVRKEELSVDLMRHLPTAPNGAMDFLFTELLLWGRHEGYRWFNFGMAPLSGLDVESGGGIWPTVGTLLFRHGEHFYNFQGLRRYKQKFDPVWTPRYLASSGGLALPVVLVDVAALIAGSVTGIVLKHASLRR